MELCMVKYKIYQILFLLWTLIWSTSLFMGILTVYNIQKSLVFFFRKGKHSLKTIFEASWNQHDDQQSVCDIHRHSWNCKYKFQFRSCCVTKRFSANVNKIAQCILYHRRKSLLWKKTPPICIFKTYWQIRFISCWKLR